MMQMFNSQICKLEAKITMIRDWTEKTNGDISNLPIKPSTFDEILATIEPQRTRKIEAKIKEVEQLIKERKALIESKSKIVKDQFSDRVKALVKLESECE